MTTEVEAPNRIEAIRERHVTCDYTAIDSQALADIAWLLASVDRVSLLLDNAQRKLNTLQSELARLRAREASGDDRS